VIKTLINGEPENTISVLDRGLHYGDGIFETIKVTGGRLLFLEQHLQRLIAGSKRLGFPQPPVDRIVAEAKSLVDGTAEAVIKIVVTRGQGGRGYRLPEHTRLNRIIIRYPWVDYPERYYTAGVTMRLCNSRLSANPQLAGIKHLNRLEQIIARSEWQDPSIAEGLMLDQEENVVEGTMSNVFLYKGNRLTTPPLRNCGVAGIMRQRVLNIAQDLGISFDISEVKPKDLLSANEMFLTNSLIGIWPVKEFIHDGGVIGYQPGPITRQLTQALAQRELS
jgi:4-amino-4-deoxychorismate lyase